MLQTLLFPQVWLGYREKMESLPRFVASQDQYLVVQHRDGHKEHIIGCVVALGRASGHKEHISLFMKLNAYYNGGALVDIVCHAHTPWAWPAIF